MAEYRDEKWADIYHKTLVELEHAHMRGRIGEARKEIVARVEKLKSLPGLHAQKDQALEDALNALKFLETEEDRYDENQRRETLAEAMRKLQSLGSKIRKVDDSSSE